MTRAGGFHCGRVRFEVDTADELVAYECNCSICHRLGFLHVIADASAFRLVRGLQSLVSYSFNTGTAKHLFCRVCGVESFYVPRSHPNGYSVNLRCLDDVAPESVRIRPFDGRNWEANAGDLPPLGE